MGKGVKIKTDGPPFSNVLCAVLLQLDQMRDSAITEEHELINSRKKLEKDLAKYGSKKTPDRTAVAEAYTNVLLALKDCRSQMRFLSDQVSKGLKYGQQPALRQSEDEEKILALVGNKGEIEERLALWQAAKEESSTVGAKVESGEGSVGGDPTATTPPAAPSSPPAGLGDLAPDGSGGPSIRRTTPVEILDKKSGKVIGQGEFDSYMVADAQYTVTIGGERQFYKFDKFTVRPARFANQVPLDTKVQVLHVATSEQKGEGTLEHETDELYRVRIGAKLKDFPKDTYRIEAVPAGAVPKIERGTAVRVLITATGELEGTGRLDAMHDQYALVTIDNRQRRFGFDAYAIEAAPAPEVSEKKKPGKKPAKA